MMVVSECDHGEELADYQAKTALFLQNPRLAQFFWLHGGFRVVIINS